MSAQKEQVINPTMLKSLRSNFEKQFGDANDLRFAMAPGRVNLLGEYTDMNDGFVLPMTVDPGVYFGIRARTDDRVRVYSLKYDELVEYSLDAPPTTEAGSWTSYVVGVVEELRRRDLVSAGFEAVFDGDLDLGAGLSSSAALEVATAIALQHLTGFSLGALAMVKMCQHVEHQYANVLCGIMDQFASRVGREGHALFLDCRSLEYKNIPIRLGEYRIVIVSSGVKRSLAASAYNTRRAECQEAVDYFSQQDSNVTALRDVTTQMFDDHGADLAPNVRQRCRHVVAENSRVLEAVELLSAGRLEEFGSLMIASHNSLRDDFEVSCEELNLLVEIATSTEGVLGARMTGAGFGGCTVNLVHKGAITTLLDRLDAEYDPQVKLQHDVFVLRGNLEAGPLLIA
jgi:galactokinase